MRIIQIRIENFGQFHDFTWDFHPGLNVIEKPNGWGKTTMAAFIKAMFYGLEATRKRTVVDQRRRYQPWQGGKYGGFATFAIANKTYRVTRFFGKTSKDDTFVLEDLDKNRPSDDYSENLGLNLWGVDRDSFEKTAFVSLQKNKLLNDLIATRLAEIDNPAADLDESTQALALLEKQSTRLLSKRGDKGIIIDLQTELNQAKSKWLEAKQASEKLAANTDEQKARQNNIAQLDRELEQISRRQKELLLYQKKREWTQLENQQRKIQTEYQNLQEFFQNASGGPAQIAADLKAIESLLKDYQRGVDLGVEYALTKSQQDQLHQLAEMFHAGVPDEPTIAVVEDQAQKIKELLIQIQVNQLEPGLQKRLNQLQAKYQDANLSVAKCAAYLEACIKVQEIQARLASKQAQAKPGAPGSKRPGKTRQLLLGLMAMAVGLALVVANWKPGWALALIGAIIGVGALKNKHSLKKAADKEASPETTELEALKKEYATVYQAHQPGCPVPPGQELLYFNQLYHEVSEYEALKEKLSSHQGQIASYQKELAHISDNMERFFQEYNVQVKDRDYFDALNRLKQATRDYASLQSQVAKLEGALLGQRTAQAALVERFGQYYEILPGSGVDYDWAKLHHSLKEAGDDYKRAAESWAKILEAIGAFKRANDLEPLRRLPVFTGDLKELNESLEQDKKALDLNRQEQATILATLRQHQDQLQAVSDSFDDWHGQIISLNDQLNKARKRHELLGVASDLLQQARDNLAARYTAKMNQAFKKYLGLLQGHDSTLYQVDINLDVKYFQAGQYHESERLSKGIQDLVQICLRLALVEAVFQEKEKPLLILDDPFVNLDALRLDKAKDLVKAIGDEYQLVYFTCHHSRNGF